MFKRLFLFMFLSMFIMNCSKISISDHQAELTMELKSLQSPIFDWENADFIDCPECPEGRLVLPWAFGAPKIGVPENISLYNHPRSDGWQLMFNSFGLNNYTGKFFALYNNYSGKLRIFFFHSGYFNLDYTFYVLKMNGSSNIFKGNYYEAEPIKIEPGKLWELNPPVFPLVVNNWHSVEFQLYYDPNFEHINEAVNYFTLSVIASSRLDVFKAWLAKKSDSGFYLFIKNELLINTWQLKAPGGSSATHSFLLSPTEETKQKRIGLWGCITHPEVGVTLNNQPKTQSERIRTREQLSFQTEFEFRDFEILINPDLEIIEKRIDNILIGRQIRDMEKYADKIDTYLSNGSVIYNFGNTKSIVLPGRTPLSPNYRINLRIRNTIDNSVVNYSEIIQPKIITKLIKNF